MENNNYSNFVAISQFICHKNMIFKMDQSALYLNKLFQAYYLT